MLDERIPTITIYGNCRIRRLLGQKNERVVQSKATNGRGYLFFVSENSTRYMLLATFLIPLFSRNSVREYRLSILNQRCIESDKYRCNMCIIACSVSTRYVSSNMYTEHILQKTTISFQVYEFPLMNCLSNYRILLINL